MARPAPDPPNDATVYLVEEDFGQRGWAYLETDTASAGRETIIRNFISGQYEDAHRVVAFNTAEGWSRDVSEDIAIEVLDRAYGADETLTDGAKRFIDRHVTSGEKRPAGTIGATWAQSGDPQESVGRIDLRGALCGEPGVSAPRFKEGRSQGRVKSSRP